MRQLVRNCGWLVLCAALLLLGAAASPQKASAQAHHTHSAPQHSKAPANKPQTHSAQSHTAGSNKPAAAAAPSNAQHSTPVHGHYLKRGTPGHSCSLQSSCAACTALSYCEWAAYEKVCVDIVTPYHDCARGTVRKNGQSGPDCLQCNVYEETTKMVYEAEVNSKDDTIGPPVIGSANELAENQVLPHGFTTYNTESERAILLPNNDEVALQQDTLADDRDSIGTAASFSNSRMGSVEAEDSEGVTSLPPQMNEARKARSMQQEFSHPGGIEFVDSPSTEEIATVEPHIYRPQEMKPVAAGKIHPLRSSINSEIMITPREKPTIPANLRPDSEAEVVLH